jgi:hypothetical protein
VIVMGGAGSSAGLHDTWALYFDETTPTALALQAVDVAGDRVRIRWFGEAAPGFTQAFKRTSGGPWAALATLTRDGSGFFTLEDSDVVAGGRYAYRLGVAEGGRMRYYGEVSVDVPRAPALSLAGTRPSPASGPLVVSFALASNTPARLEVIDIQGRRVFMRDVGALGAGAHIVRLDPTGDLPAGVYLLRLDQGGRSATAKAVIAR